MPPTESDLSPPRGKPFPIVGIGASAGGLEAFEQLLRAVPPDTGMAFVLVQHLDPQHESLLAEILSRATTMPVVTVHDRIAVEPNSVYVIPPDSSMVLEDGHLRLEARESGLHLPIDIFFQSLATVQGSRAIGVVLSGSASDGSLGILAIKSECGLTFAQEEATAKFGAMPHNAIATGAVDYVLPPSQIGLELGRLKDHPYLIPARPGEPESETLPDGDGELKRIFRLLHSATKVDFSHYKPTTIRRRIGRRMMFLRIENLDEYVRYAERHPAEVNELYRDLLISVTSFFRDPASFEALSRFVSKALSETTQRNEAVRVWAPGCATGEEVYSLAITLFELLEERQLAVPLQLFGTDISELALNRARHGIYSEIITQDVAPERLRRFFTKADGGYQINRIIRESCIFARHDLTGDPPFSHLDVVSCRNVLIYLDSKAQRSVLPVLHYALKPLGLLMLGSAETAGPAKELFEPLDKHNHIYARKQAKARLSLELAAGRPAEEVNPPRSHAPSPGGAGLHKRVDRLIQSKYSPDAVLVDAQLEIVEFRGHTSPYLDPSPGEASLNLLRMARDSLVVPLRRALHAAAKANASVQESGAVVDQGRHEEIRIEVNPVQGNTPQEQYFLVVFASGPAQPDAALQSDPAAAIVPGDEHLLRLQRELADTREYLRNVTEDYEAHAEELRAANEEARSSNEELQSINEELGTTKEELQSTNEELTTVNEELQNRNRELSATNSDLKNLLSAVKLGILIVNQDLRLRRYNTTAGTLLQLGPLDIGRPVGHIRGSIAIPNLEKQILQVLDTLHTIEEEVQDVAGRWHSIAVRPYRTLDDRIAGAVITIQDIDLLKRGLQAAEEARDYADGILETVREPLIVLDADLRVQRATAAFYETFLVSREETEGRFLYDLGNGQWNRPRLRELMGAALFSGKAFHDYEEQHDFPHIGVRTVRLNARRIPRLDGRDRTLLLAIEDVTERRQTEIRFQRLFETAADGIAVVDAETETVLDVNPHLLELTRFGREDFIGKRLAETGPFLNLPAAADLIESTRRNEIVRHTDIPLALRNGEEVCVDLVANSYQVGSQLVVQFNIRDITWRKQAAKELRESEERFRLLVESVRDYALFQLDSSGLILAWNTGAERLLGWKEAEVIGRSFDVLFPAEDVARGDPGRELEKARSEGRAEDERWRVRKDGSRFFASGILSQVRDENGLLRGFAKIMQDITDRKEQEERLRRSLDEKSMLVREIHHRVKNNLQVIVSLLSLQSGHTNDPHVLAAFEETEGRVRAIAQIHERLYASEDLTEIEFASYLTRLANDLVALHTTVPGSVAVNVQAEEVVLEIEQAIPLGLIANELIVNSLKHGLNGRTGQLDVTLRYLPDPGGLEPCKDGQVQLRVRDCGRGLPKDFDISSERTMGFRLINLLVRQLRGRLEIGGAPGANIAVTSPLNVDDADSTEREDR